MKSDSVRMNEDQLLIRRFQNGSPEDAHVESSRLAQALRARVANVDAQIGRVEILFEPDDLFIQAEQVIQGGAVAAMLDFAMAFAALATLPDGQSVATANLNVSYLRAAKSGTFRAVGELDRRGKTLVFSRAVLSQADGVAVATATSTLSVIRLRELTREGLGVRSSS